MMVNFYYFYIKLIIILYTLSLDDLQLTNEEVKVTCDDDIII